MRKMLILAGAVLFLAAACNNSSQPASYTPPAASQTSGITVDNAVNALNGSVDSEEVINLQNDDDIINSDKTVINSYDGVSNANY